MYLAGQGAEQHAFHPDLFGIVVADRSAQGRAVLSSRLCRRTTRWVAFNDESDFTLRKVPLARRPSCDDCVRWAGEDLRCDLGGLTARLSFRFQRIRGSGLMRLSERRLICRGAHDTRQGAGGVEGTRSRDGRIIPCPAARQLNLHEARHGWWRERNSNGSRP